MTGGDKAAAVVYAMVYGFAFLGAAGEWRAWAFSAMGIGQVKALIYWSWVNACRRFGLQALQGILPSLGHPLRV